jgi:hypothetical protein
MTDEQQTVWVIRFRDEIRVRMVTNPPAEFAVTEAERDWYLRTTTRPLEEFVVEEVPGPLKRAMDAERERWERAKTELRREARQRFLDGQRRGSGG